MKNHFTAALIGLAALSLTSGIALGASATSPIALSQRPLFLGEVPPLNMLIMSRDHKLYYAAYNDASDLDGDGVIDIHYKPATIDYYGYFDSTKCYNWDNTNNEFYPSALATNKQCSGKWSGDFLNYLTMSRIDLVRKALYGGKRSIDGGTSGSNRNTVLERAFVPQDTHSWAKQYESVAVDGYDITKYAPLSLPTTGKRHLFSTTNLNASQTIPRLRVFTNSSGYAYTWGASESNSCFAANNSTCNGVAFPTFTKGTNEFYVRVRVCDGSPTGLALGLENNCKAYVSAGSTYYKPIGRLQAYGESNSMLFGLITGSYDQNISGGVLRKGMSSITNEINAKGQFIGTSSGVAGTAGVIGSVDNLKVIKFNGSHTDCTLGSGASYAAASNGMCTMWGNPVGEMMYEAARYFGGATSPTNAFTTATANDTTAGLPTGIAWPTGSSPLYTATASLASATNKPFNRCAKPFMMVLSDIYPSYDSDQLPGSYFGPGLTNDVLSLNVATTAGNIWNEEGLGTKSILIGQSSATYNGAPTAKSASSFSTLRGLVPEEPTRQGSYYAPAVAYHAKANDINPVLDEQKVTTIAVAFASPVPNIVIPVSVSGQAKTITLVPFGKSVGPNGSFGITTADTTKQPTNSFAGFYVESLTPTSGKFRVNFEDQERGNDYDLDAVALYEYQVNGDGTVTIKVTSDYAQGGITQHLGYVISGTTQDGLYMEVRDHDTKCSTGGLSCSPNTESSANDVDAPLDTPPGVLPGGAYADGVALPSATSFVATRTFTPSASPSATVLKDPLWYAAKYGGFFEDATVATPNNKPDVTSEWDSTGSGNPDAYILVSRPNIFEQQLDRAFYEVFRRLGAAASVATNTTSSQSSVTVYQGSFQVAGPDWNGDLLAIPFNTTTGAFSAPDWNAADGLITVSNPSARLVWTRNPTTDLAVDFQYLNLDVDQKTALDTNPVTGTVDTKGPDRVNYLRGSASNEGIGVNNFRKRSKSKLGDIINSSPVYVGDFQGAARDPVVYVGANDGMLHAFSAKSAIAGGGTELFAYIPNAVVKNLNKLTDKIYSHQYYTDGSPTVADAEIGSQTKTILVAGLNAGGAGIYALDVTNPGNFTAANANTVPLWEFTEADDASGDLGFTYGKPLIVKLSNGKWAAVFANGYNSTTQKGVLYINYLEKTGAWAEGANFFKIAVPGGANGLSAPVSIDIESDGDVDYVYAGDLNGKLWRFDLKNLAALTATEIFQAKDASNNPQPITTRPDITVHPVNFAETLLLFGTGRYLTTGDPGATTTQSFYAVWDKLTSASVSSLSRSTLQQQEIIGSTTSQVNTGPTGTTVTYTQAPRPGSSPVSLQTYASMMPILPNPNPVVSTSPTSATSTTTTQEYRATSAYTLDWNTKNGWFIDFDYPANSGERAPARPVLQSGLVIFSTLQPSTDSCDVGGVSYLMALSYGTGGQDPRRVFDTSGDRQFNANDVLAGGVKIDATVGGVTVVSQYSSPGGYSGKGAGENGVAFGPCTGPGCTLPCTGPGCTLPCTGPSCTPPPEECIWGLTVSTSSGRGATCINPGSIAGGRITWKELISQ